MKDIFTNVYKTNYWNSSESRSGCGSEMRHTKEIRHWLIDIVYRYNIKLLADVPCGDFNWMKSVRFPGNFFYLGCDIVDEMIEINEKLYGTDHRQFMTFDMTFDILPRVDLIFCKDVFLHLSYKDILTAIELFKQSKSKYLIVSNAISHKENMDKKTGGDHRMINLSLPPFDFPPYIEIINPGFTQMCMYEIDKL